MSISMYVPKTMAELHDIALSVAQAHNEHPQKIISKFMAFGHMYGHDVARTAMLTYMRGNSPCLKAEGLKCAVLASGKLLWFRYIEQSAERCIIEVKRSDFPSDVPPQRFEYTWEDAVRAGNSRQANYIKMPAAMLTARCWSKMARDYFPDVVGGFYSIEEMMDNENMNDDERAMISAQSMGEEINLSTRPQPQSAPPPTAQPQPQPVPQPAPQHIEIDQSINSLPVPQMPTGRKHRADDPIAYAPTPSTGFNDLVKLEATYKNIGLQVVEAAKSMSDRGLDANVLSPEDHKTFFYRWAFSEVVRENNALEDEWWQRRTSYSHVFNEIQLEFKLLSSVDHSDIVRAFVEVNDAFFELCRVAAYIKEGGSLWVLAQQTLKAIIEKKKGMPAVREIYNKVMGY